MLQEVLLALSGHPSPLFSRDATSIPGQDDALPPLSPPEKDLLAQLGHLRQLNLSVKGHCSVIIKCHASTICRSVAAAIADVYLNQFQDKIISVERGILRKDAAYVGGYGIVPLSTIVTEFAPWTRKMEWLLVVARFMLPEDTSKSDVGSFGAALISRLRRESHTGYSDLEVMALNLLEVAEMAWLRQASSWLLYGKLPAHGTSDFFIIDFRSSNIANDFDVLEAATPDFVSAETARSIVFIGKSLIQAQDAAKSKSLREDVMNNHSHRRLIQHNLEQLQSLESPFTAQSLASTIDVIRNTVSRKILSKILPLQLVRASLRVLQHFMLLSDGDFAYLVIRNADSRVTSRHRRELANVPAHPVNSLDSIVMQDGDVSGLLQQAWSDLLASRDNDADVDECIDLGRRTLHLRLDRRRSEAMAFDTFLLPATTSLHLELPRNSSLDLFLAPQDLDLYSEINSFLISIRRASLHLSAQWKLSVLRRVQPSPLKPPLSATKDGQKRTAAQRQVYEKRWHTSRYIWATISKALFVISELDTYLHGEVISRANNDFNAWFSSLEDSEVNDDIDPDSTSSAENNLKNPTSGFRTSQQSHTSSRYRPSRLSTHKQHSDPATLASAHQRYLQALQSSLLLDEPAFCSTLHTLLKTLDHFVALFPQLEAAQQNLDLDIKSSADIPLSSYVQDERRTLEEMKRSGKDVEEQITALIKAVQVVEERRRADTRDLVDGLGRMELGFVPWKSRTLERLLIKLDCLSGDREGLENGYEDDLL